MKLSFLFPAAVAVLTTAAHGAISIPGDIMITGYNADGSDDLAFVLLNSYVANTPIFFTDNEWDGTAWADTNESVFHWSSPVNLDAGTVITLNSLSATPSASTGSTVFDNPTNIGLAAGNESVYAFVGSSFDTATPTFITAFANSGFVSAATGFLTGTGLTAGSTATEFTGGQDIFAYTGDRASQAAWADYAPLVAATGNWVSEDGAGDQSVNTIAPDVPFNTTSFTTVPEPGAALLLTFFGGLGALSIRRRH